MRNVKSRSSRTYTPSQGCIEPKTLQEVLKRGNFSVVKRVDIETRKAEREETRIESLELETLWK